MANDDIKAKITKADSHPDGQSPAAKKPKLSNPTDPDLSEEDKIYSDALTNIEEIEVKINAIEDECSIEICKLEQQFVEKKLPLFEKRGQLIDNNKEAVPNFWVKALLNHDGIANLLKEDDKKAIQYLTKIEVDQKTREEKATTEDGLKYVKSLNYSIKFTFSENPYFENKTLTKSFFQVLEDILSENEGEIIWKEGHNLLEIYNEKKKQKQESKEQDVDDSKSDVSDDRSSWSGYVDESFFAWFEDHHAPHLDELAECIKDDLWLRASQLYSGDA